MRHASVMALWRIARMESLSLDWQLRQGCDWASADGDVVWGQVDALDLLDGRRPRREVTCAACAALVDLALEMRGS
jgi:hypothetical protein